MIDDYHLDAGLGRGGRPIRSARIATRNGSGEHLLFSFHGLPQRLADDGDPYAAAMRGQRARDRAARWACATTTGR